MNNSKVATCIAGAASIALLLGAASTFGLEGSSEPAQITESSGANTSAGAADEITEITMDSIPAGTVLVGEGEIVLDGDASVVGRLKHLGLVQHGTNPPGVYEVSSDRYVVVAPSTMVGAVVPLEPSLVDPLCRDLDGCSLVLQMVDRFVSQPGNVTSRTAHLFLSQTSNWWQLSVGVVGDDANAANSQWDDAALDQCRFTDAETSTGSNLSSDSVPGFGLLNLAGGVTDANSCRLLISD